MTKAIIDFTPYPAAELAPVARQIQTSLAKNLATFPNLPTSPAALLTLIGEYEGKLAAKQSRAISDTLAFDAVRHELEGVLGDLGNEVNIVAKGDPVIVGLSGFPSYETSNSPDLNPPAAPKDVVLRQGDASGSFVSRCKPARQKSMNEVQTCQGDPNVETNWKHAGTFSGGKATVGGFTPGTVVWVRIRTLGIRGILGAWSDPAKIMVV